jgi:hypothetical protein
MSRTSIVVAMTALVVAMGGTALAAGDASTTLHMRVTKDGKLIGNNNDGTVRKAGVGIYEITFNPGPTGGKVPLNLDDCAIVATPRVETQSTGEELAANINVQRIGPARIFVESRRPLPFGENKITPFPTNVSFDVAVIC